MPKSPKRKVNKKPLGQLILTLESGKQYDFFKLPHDVRQALLSGATGDAIRKAILEFKGK